MNNLVFTMVARGFGWNLIRTVFAWLDSVIYTVFAWAMQLIFDIVNVTGSPIFQGFYENIQTRIYAILAIFMLFKITISLLSYLVNPDTVSDKERGLGKMATRVIISLVMLMFFPKVFGFMQNVQPHILEALPRVILGVSYVDNKQTADQLEMVGKDIAFSIYHGAWFNENCADGNFNDSGQCFMYGNDISVIPEHINDAADGDSSKYRYDYYPVIGLVIGIIATLIIVGICMDVAIRVFKLIILQIIAPIPILSYIDPKSSKDGAFSKWVKMLTSVYLDLFIKLGVVYFIILVINSLVINNTIQNLSSELFGSGIRGVLVLIALVIGLLFFAKEAPKFICDALGIKSSDNGKLFGGLGKVMAAGAIGAGAIGSAVASGRANYLSDEAREKGHNPLRLAKNVGAGLLGGLAGVGTGAVAAVNAKDHNAKAALDAMTKRNSIALARGAAGSTMLGRGIARGQNLILGETSYDRMNKEKASLEAANKNTVAYKNTMEKKALEKDASKLSIKWNGHDLNWLEYMANLDGAKNGNEASLQWMIDHGFSKMATVQEEYDETYMEEYDEEYEETYTEFEEVGGEWVPVTKTRTATRKATRPATRTATRTVQKVVADWQSAQVQQDKIKDAVTQAHAAKFMEAVRKYEETGDRTVFTDFGTEYNDYRNARDANEDAGFKDVDYANYGNGSGTGLKQTLGKQNEKITNIATSTKYKGAKANADATKK